MDLQTFYKKKGKSKTEGEYDYDDHGNLIVRDKQGSVIQTIALPTYRSPTFEEIKQMEEDRKAAILQANQAFDQARKVLHDAMQQGDQSMDALLILNRHVEEADQHLQSVRFPVHCVTMYSNIKVNQLDFTQMRETRAFPYSIAVQEVHPFPLQEYYVRTGDAEARKPLVSVAEAKEAAKAPVILFGNPKDETYGFLSLDWPIQLTDPTFPAGYHSARQAIAEKMAAGMEDEENRAKIAATTEASDVHYTLNDVPGAGDGTEEKWNALMKRFIEEVNRMKFTQHPELGEKLLTTQKAELGAMEPEDYLLGIGLSADEPEAQMKDRWTGQNELGKALMKIRGELQAAAPKKRPVIVKPVEAALEAPALESASALEAPALESAPALEPALPSASIALVAPSKNAARTPRRRPPISSGKAGRVYLGTKSRSTSWSERPDPSIRVVDVTSAQASDSIRRRNFSPFTEIEGGYKGYFNFEHYWQSGKVFKGIPEERTKAWWKEQKEPKRRYPGSEKLEVLYSSWPDQTPFHEANEHMDWVTSRKKVYVPEYFDLIKDRESTIELKAAVEQGQDIMVYDYDGPKGANGVPMTIEITPETLKQKIEDTSAAFGHGYIVAAWLKGISPEQYLS